MRAIDWIEQGQLKTSLEFFWLDAGNCNLGVKYVSVYIPQAYHGAGQPYVVKRERGRMIDNHSPPDVNKYAVTGGAVKWQHLSSLPREYSFGGNVGARWRATSSSASTAC